MLWIKPRRPHKLLVHLASPALSSVLSEGLGAPLAGTKFDRRRLGRR
jgi:hypothetical protein